MSPRVDNLIDRLMAERPTRPGDAFHDSVSLWRRYLRHYRRGLIAAVVLTLIWSALPLAFPFTWKFLIDVALEGGERISLDLRPHHQQLILVWLAINVGLWAATLTTTWLRQRLVIGIGQGLVYRLRRDLHRKLQALHVGFFEKTPVGIIMSRVLDDVSIIHRWVTRNGPRGLASAVKVVAGMAVLFYFRWELALVVTACLPGYAWAFARFRPRVRRANRALRRLNAKMYARSTERVGGVGIVQAFTREKAEANAFAKLTHDSVRVAMRLTRYTRTLSFLAGVITAVTRGVVIYIGALMVRDGHMSLGTLLGFMAATRAVFMATDQLTNTATAMQAAFVVVRRVLAVLEEPEEVPPGKISLDGMSGKIVFDRVSFTYPQQDRAALDEVGFHIEPGDKVALMGPSGSGKSTVCQLLLRFYDPSAGNVRVGGVNLVDADPASVRRHIRMVEQEPTVFAGTIAENIRYAKLDATAEQVRRAAQQAELHEFIESLPMGYDTEIGEGGTTLSGGQKQRLALATALLTEPEILLLDDTTSALDAATEARIRHTLDHVLSGRTSLIVTQRSATARNCDRILVFEDGRITQEGTHQQLSAVDGFYRRVARQQAEP